MPFSKDRQDQVGVTPLAGSGLVSDLQWSACFGTL